MDGLVNSSQLHTGLSELSTVESLLSPDRACLAFTLAELSARPEVKTNLESLWAGWTGRKLPFLVRPLRWLFTGSRSLSLVKKGEAVVGLARALRESDRYGDFVDLWSVPAPMVERVVAYVHHGGDPEDLLLTEPAAAGLQIETLEMAPETQWAFTVRRWPACPTDLAAALDAFGEERDATASEGGPGGPTSGCS